MPNHVTLQPVGKENWQALAKLKVSAEQRKFVAEPTYYLALCFYEKIWNPLAICLDEQVIGFLMWGDDPEESSCWLGGFFIDLDFQSKGYGRKALESAIGKLSEENGYRHFALSYHPENAVAKTFYVGFGFNETGEMAEDEIVARHYLDG
jgi:diamine N-acetyltransferase